MNLKIFIKTANLGIFGVFLAQSSANATYYYGPMDGENSVPGQFVVVQGEDAPWHARSVLPKDLEKIQTLITAYGTHADPALKDAAVYLYDGGQDNPLNVTQQWFKRHQARISEVEGSTTRPGPYQWLWFQAGNQSGLIFVERMPRAVTYTDRQVEILDLYKRMGTMNLASDGGEELAANLEYVGKHRTIPDQAILEIRILPENPRDPALDAKTLTDILNTLNRFFQTMSRDHVAPFYPTDTAADRPALTFSYTHYADLHPAYEGAQFTEEKAEIYQEYYPDGSRSGPRSIFYRRFSESTPALEADPSLVRLLSGS